MAGEDESFTSASPRFVKGFMLLLAALGIGAQISVWLTALTGLTFPSYIGAMLTAVVIRNVMIAVNVEYPDQEIDTMGTMFLSIFLALALSSLKLWELVDLALPMIICLLLQCVVMVIFSYFVVFNVMGRDYEAAVMSAGFIGFAMGATSNAMANMQVVTKKYGPAPSDTPFQKTPVPHLRGGGFFLPGDRKRDSRGAVSFGGRWAQALRMMPMGVDSLDWPRGLSPRILASWSRVGSFWEKPRMLAPRSLMSTMATGCPRAAASFLEVPMGSSGTRTT